ncbi:hypothetical protein RDI58_008518 [Solanum bulbocastanum]|uniref:Cytochrome P450 n=1 Tax=Solanum bulbocastanum TaxID=147425 RepID=A0AAN8TVY2_SOLBU
MEYFLLVPLLAFIYFLHQWFFSPSYTQKRLLPPSPRKLPIIGNLHQLGSLPHRSLHKLSKRYGPVMLLHFGSKPVLVASSVNAARDIMKTHNLVWSNRPKSSITDGLFYGSKDVAFTSYGVDWRQIKSIVMFHIILGDAFVGGTESVYTSLEWTMMELLMHPRVLKKLEDEVRELGQGKTEITEDDLGNMQYLKAVIKESFRLHPPNPLLLPRESREDVKLLDYDKPSKTQGLINAWAMGRDPLLQNFELIRGCPGMTFAIIINELALARIVQKFNFALPKEEDLDMTECNGLSVRRKLPLLATKWSIFLSFLCLSSFTFFISGSLALQTPKISYHHLLQQSFQS